MRWILDIPGGVWKWGCFLGIAAIAAFLLLSCGVVGLWIKDVLIR